MRRKKNFELRFERVRHLLIDNPQSLKGGFAKQFDCSKIKLEIGCGKGGFITELALREPNVFFIGMEKVSNVLLSALEQTASLELKNIRFIEGDAQNLSDIFGNGEIDELFLNFSDPWPKDKQAFRRLTHRNFLNVYKQILKPDAALNFKTDNRPLFDFSVSEIQECGWETVFISYDLPIGDDNIQTEYETRFRGLGVPINKITAKTCVTDAPN